MGEVRNNHSDNDTHAAPVWLDEAYLEPILQRSKKDPGLRILQLDIKPATAKGENYASIMTRVKVNYLASGSKVPGHDFYIVKTTYENDPYIAGVFGGYDVATTEMQMYEKILPQLTDLLQQTSNPEKVFAQTLHVDYEHAAIIFEDLTVTKHQTADRLIGFDMEHAQLALRKLAKMHAAAAVLNEQQPGVLTKYDHGIFNRHTQGFAPFFTSMVGVAAEFAAETSELGPYYEQKLKAMQKRVMEYSTRAYDPQPDQFNTLIHGDYWVNNVMVRYNENSKELQDLVMIDFQFCSWSSPAVDLHYFFNTSLETEVRFQHQDALVQYYHSILVQTLKDLNFSGYIPTLRQFVLQMEKARFFAVTVSLVSHAIMINDQNADADFNGLMLDDERGRKFRKLIYTNKKLRDILQRLLPVFDRCGLLDVVD
ncbi:uncharacterized protein Dwil_GK14343 [Drosophila willistoni]|uniref:CHK kinase-like domain-containing protein n=1 Tax=Drosophila willistoni TaxID=7260 RepID=B4NIU5_DROWI|nr:uncharacterized protein LOC6651254 [Drosophila willistoni]EDW84847.1 uncharacterized protein Dwil_GK14343 [Drosophila willistoni]